MFQLAFEVIVAIIILILGILLLIYSSDKAVEHSVIIASALGISPLMIGLVLVSLGTDFPEIATSIISSAEGHGDIIVGAALGSVLTQMTLVFGLLPFFGRIFKVKRKKIVIVGACLILGIMLGVSIADKGYISRMDALFLVASWPIFLLITRTVTSSHVAGKEQAAPRTDRRRSYHVTIAVLGFVGVAVGAYAVVESVIALSAVFQIPEYIISFFVVSIGTSLPEIVVDLTAVRKKHYELAVGDAIGSSIIDATFSIGIGSLIFPLKGVSSGLVTVTGLYVLFASIVIISTLALREKVDRKAGALFLVLYVVSYLLLQA